MPNQPSRAIIFDFDGTIADSFQAFLEVVGDVLHRPIPSDPEEIHHLRQLSARQIMSYLKVRPWQVPFLLARGRRLMGARIPTTQTFPGLPQAIEQLSADYRLFILSTNTQANINLFLQGQKLQSHFERVYGGAGLFNKWRLIAKLQREAGLSAANCVYVGDEVRDIEAAHKAGIKCVSVGWGYTDPDVLAAQPPDVLVRQPQDLARAVAGLLRQP